MNKQQKIWKYTDINVNGECLNSIRYAPDTVVFVGSMEGLQKIMNKISHP